MPLIYRLKSDVAAANFSARTANSDPPGFVPLGRHAFNREIAQGRAMPTRFADCAGYKGVDC